MKKAATPSRAIDGLLVAVLLAWMLGTAGSLRVYDRVTPTRVSVVAIGRDGTRTPEDTPSPLARVDHGIWRTRSRVEQFARSEPGRRLVPPGGRLEWTIHHSENSLRFDRASTFETSPR